MFNLLTRLNCERHLFAVLVKPFRQPLINYLVAQLTHNHLAQGDDPKSSAGCPCRESQRSARRLNASPAGPTGGSGFGVMFLGDSTTTPVEHILIPNPSVRLRCQIINQRFLSLFLLTVASILAAPVSLANANTILLQSTTSTANSGLYDYLLAHFKQTSGVQVNVVAVGTGQAIKNARNCDGDVLIVHAKSSEEQFVNDGFGVERFDLMYNDFVLVGPAEDNAEIANSDTITDALERIAKSTSLFVSRGDESGTHKKERDLWSGISVDPTLASGRWYRETGSGMGATLNIAVGMRAYTLTDRATWISFKNKDNFEILYEGDNALFNQYGVILVNPIKCPNVKAESSQQFIDWLLSEAGQQTIADYKVLDQQLFYPNAQKR